MEDFVGAALVRRVFSGAVIFDDGAVVVIGVGDGVVPGEVDFLLSVLADAAHRGPVRAERGKNGGH